MCTWPPVSEVCPNYEVVGLQHWTMNPPHLGSVNIFKLKLALLPHLFLTFVWIFILTPPSYSPPICIRSLYSYSLICTCYPPPLPAQSAAHLDISRTCHPSASAACLCAPVRMTASAVFHMTMRPPLFRTRPAPISLSSPGVFTSYRSLRASVKLTWSPIVLLRILASSGPWSLVGRIFAGGREARPPPLPGSRSHWTSPPLLIGRAGAVQDNPPPVGLIPSPSVEGVVRSARSR